MELHIPKAFSELFSPSRYKIYWGGRGSAKSWSIARALLVIGVQRRLRILCAREIQKSIRESVHKLLADQIEQLQLKGHYQVLDAEIRGANGSEFIFAGLHRNIDSIQSTEAIDIVWIEEAHAVSDESWRVLIPTIRKPGSEIWASFNPRHKQDAVYQRFVVHQREDATVRKVSWRDNPWFTDEMRAELEADKARDYEMYLHVWEGEFLRFTEGAIYAKQLREAREQNRICRVPIQSACEVNTFWDLGKNDATAIWFHQRVGPENRFIDYYENRLVDLDHYIRVLKEKDYLYGTHYLPHDVEFDMLGMTETRKEQLELAGVKPISVVSRIPNLNEGIEMARKAFSTCWFDEDRCEEGLDALSSYQYEYDEQHKTFRQKPAHNWASNGADAFRQFAQGYRPSAGWAGALKPKQGAYSRAKHNPFKQSQDWRV